MSPDELPDDVSEADALDQRREVGGPTDDPEAAPATAVSDNLEVPEADAIDQAREVPVDDEPDPEG